MPNIRKGSGYSWSNISKTLAGGEREESGFIVDNLDTKQFNDAANNYERIFIIARDILQSKPQDNILQSAQDIADAIRQKGLIK
tara:strand:- start:1614 stop:1865 length:252 start_codon:yes stop_codon:yes gene_type:complete